MKQVFVPFEDISIKEYLTKDKDGNEKSLVCLVVTLIPTEGDSLNLVVRMGPNMIGSLVEVLNHYYNTVFPDADALELNLTEAQFKLRHLSVGDERQV